MRPLTVDSIISPSFSDRDNNGRLLSCLMARNRAHMGTFCTVVQMLKETCVLANLQQLKGVCAQAPLSKPVLQFLNADKELEQLIGMDPTLVELSTSTVTSNLQGAIEQVLQLADIQTVSQIEAVKTQFVTFCLKAQQVCAVYQTELKTHLLRLKDAQTSGHLATSFDTTIAMSLHSVSELSHALDIIANIMQDISDAPLATYAATFADTYGTGVLDLLVSISKDTILSEAGWSADMVIAYVEKVLQIVTTWCELLTKIQNEVSSELATLIQTTYPIEDLSKTKILCILNLLTSICSTIDSVVAEVLAVISPR